MADNSTIEWTDATWNPVTGCTKISRGCDKCYAQRFSERFRGTPGHPFESGFDLTLRPKRLAQPLAWKKSKLIFVNSMSDLFHKEIPSPYIENVFQTMMIADHHTYQVLTKRSSLMRRFINERFVDSPVPSHIWLGVSIEDMQYKQRLEHLKQANAAIKFVSLEPLLGPVNNLDLSGIDWVIVGGESGPGARPINPDWVREVRDQCLDLDIPFFFKQWGGIRPKANGNTLDGRQWLQYPDSKKYEGECINEKGNAVSWAVGM